MQDESDRNPRPHGRERKKSRPGPVSGDDIKRVFAPERAQAFAFQGPTKPAVITRINVFDLV